MSRFYFFCTPVHNSAQGMIAATDNRYFRVSQHFPSPGGTGSAVSAWLSGSIGLYCLTMLVREPVHGMQGLLERQGYKSFLNPVEVNSPLGGVRLDFAFPLAVKEVTSFTQPRTSPERTYEILGHTSWPKVASQRANAHCLRPQAEFARASGRGLRRVQNFIKDAKGMCKKKSMQRGGWF
jgi:hypothetical protein